MRVNSYVIACRVITHYTTSYDMAYTSQVWENGMEYSLDDLAQDTPFVDVWRVVLPVVISAIKSIHR